MVRVGHSNDVEDFGYVVKVGCGFENALDLKGVLTISSGYSKKYFDKQMAQTQHNAKESSLLRLHELAA